jgi:hypothetical protein
LKYIYYILLTICLIGVTPAIQAQIFSTAELRTPFQSESQYDFPQSSFRSTSSYSTSYKPASDGLPAEQKFGDTHFRTAASRIVGGILSDDMGYIPTCPRQNSDVLYDDDGLYDDEEGGTQAPPEIAPIGFGWDVVVFMLMLCLAYVLYLRKKPKTN